MNIDKHSDSKKTIHKTRSRFIMKINYLKNVIIQIVLKITTKLLNLKTPNLLQVKKFNIALLITTSFMSISQSLQADNQEFTSYVKYVPIALENEKIIIVTVPKIGSLSLIKWGMAASGFADLYGIDVKLPSLSYNPANYKEIFELQPNLSYEFLKIFCSEGEMNWHSVFHHPACFFNLQNSCEFPKKLDDPKYEKYIVFRSIGDRLITAYMNHYYSFKKELIETNQLSPEQEYSFKDLINLLHTKKYQNEHINPYSQLLPFEIKSKIKNFKLIQLENLSYEIDRISKEKNISILLSDIPNIHKNKLFGDTIYEQVYDIPHPFLTRESPVKDKECWFDEEMKQQIRELFHDDFELFGTSCF